MTASQLDCHSQTLKCGYWDWKSSQYMNLMSSATSASAMTRMMIHSRRLVWMLRYCTW